MCHPCLYPHLSWRHPQPGDLGKFEDHPPQTKALYRCRSRCNLAFNLGFKAMKTLRSTLSRFRRLTLIQRYALATALTVLAAGGQWALTPNLDSHPLL